MATSKSTPPILLARLSLMMFLQYWPLGLWVVTIGTYLAANTGEEGAGIFSSGFAGYSGSFAALSSLFAPALFGWITDRYFPAERVMVVLHLLSALSLWGMHEATTEVGFAVAMVCFFHCFLPTISLTNTIALHHLSNSESEFFYVRFFSTLSWICAGLFIGYGCTWIFGESIEATRIPLLIALGSHIVMACYCITLPKCPVAKKEQAKTGEAVVNKASLLRNRPLLVFLLVSFLASIPSQAYNLANLFLNQQGYEGAAAKLTIGQLGEAMFVLCLPLLIPRFGLKNIFLFGVVGWGLRYLLFAFGSGEGGAWLVYTAIAVHGPCYLFVYVAGQLYIDRLVPTYARGAAQGLHTVATSGLGHLVGALLCGWAQAKYLTPEGVHPPPYDWFGYWLTPVAACAVAAVVFVLAFSSQAPEDRGGPGDDGSEPPTELHPHDAPPSPMEAFTDSPVE